MKYLLRAWWVGLCVLDTARAAGAYPGEVTGPFFNNPWWASALLAALWATLAVTHR